MICLVPQYLQAFSHTRGSGATHAQNKDLHRLSAAVASGVSVWLPIRANGTALDDWRSHIGRMVSLWDLNLMGVWLRQVCNSTV
jgi:hypothetical protein